MNKSVLKKVIELSVANIAEFKSASKWNAINIFKDGFRLQVDTDNINDFEVSDYSDNRPFGTIWSQKMTLKGHNSLPNAIKGIVDFARFRNYLINTIASEAPECKEIFQKVVKPIFTEMIAVFGEESGAGIVFGTADLDDFIDFIQKDSKEFLNNKLVEKATECGMSKEKATDLVDNGQATEIVAELKKRVSNTKTLAEWVDLMEINGTQVLKLTNGISTIILQKVYFPNEGRYLTLVTEPNSVSACTINFYDINLPYTLVK